MIQEPLSPSKAVSKSASQKCTSDDTRPAAMSDIVHILPKCDLQNPHPSSSHNYRSVISHLQSGSVYGRRRFAWLSRCSVRVNWRRAVIQITACDPVAASQNDRFLNCSALQVSYLPLAIRRCHPATTSHRLPRRDILESGKRGGNH